MKQLSLDLGPEPEFSLERFVVGDNAALLAHLNALGPGEAPTLIWGAMGSGKTHLLNGLARQWRHRGQGVVAFDGETRGRWVLPPTASLVLIDDADRLDAAQQHEAFAVFIEAVGRGATVVATSRLPVVDMAVREDLRTRLGWGPSFALRPLSEAALRELLAVEGVRRGLVLPPELLDYVLLRFTRDPAALIPLLDRLDRYALQTKRAPTVPLLRQMLHEPDAI
ncbi:HdaA/DnaA family protein [Inhella gelatinilytica]|uniref:Type IV secretion system DNA-binding domain-containing protein n=1 Tax=Inhella gelatinilytica TaxID=2795030 RepID=A0A931IVS3_9BURK|nr:type IV secretion system DNA-binding domain-containing protein [Inhella gelatinilytica]MBH9552837.1 type IV secretion system DNA-binding domain-containing protein [Inhella gelatinilytica]